MSEKDYKLQKAFNFEKGPVSIKDMKIATINNCDIVYNSDQGTLFVAGKEWEKVNEEFSNLKNILADKLDVALDEDIKSFELISDNKVFTGTKPVDAISNYYQNSNPNRFNDIFNEDSSYFVIRIVPKGKNTKSANWYDLIIEPASARTYRLRLVYRNKDIQKVENIASNLGNKLVKVMNIVEEQ